MEIILTNHPNIDADHTLLCSMLQTLLKYLGSTTNYDIIMNHFKILGNEIILHFDRENQIMIDAECKN